MKIRKLEAVVVHAQAVQTGLCAIRMKIMRKNEKREENKIILQTSLAGSWFILRTHGEEIADVEGGTWTEIEEGAYLIQAAEPMIRIQVKTAGLHYSK